MDYKELVKVIDSKETDSSFGRYVVCEYDRPDEGSSVYVLAADEHEISRASAWYEFDNREDAEEFVDAGNTLNMTFDVVEGNRADRVFRRLLDKTIATSYDKEVVAELEKLAPVDDAINYPKIWRKKIGQMKRSIINMKKNPDSYVDADKQIAAMEKEIARLEAKLDSR